MRPDTLTSRDFLAAIEADPNDPEPKLAMADWLEENDQPDLAYCYRWCAKHGRHPQCRQDEVLWYWIVSGRNTMSHALPPEFVVCTYHNSKTMAHAFGKLSDWIATVRKALEIPA
jgi:uncharacterized protein (TIGR02996 family)